MSKIRKIVYWIATLVVASGMLASGIQELLHMEVEGALAPPFLWGIVKLGYPVYFLTILGVWKLLGTVAILAPRSPLIKEWAYAGIFFLLTGALYSHVASDHAWSELVPASFLLILTVISWYLRPVERKFESE
ncbi:MAG: DoxX family protein [Leptospiraceae bacterium]